MPVTPFHFGVGLLGKGVTPRAVSFSAFVASQLVIDCESGYYMFVAHEWPAHRWLHTFALGSIVGIAAGIAVCAIAARIQRFIGHTWPASETALWPCLVGGLLGGVSHQVLDGIMHGDIQPLRPFADGNPFLGVIGLGPLHLLCVVAGVVGFGLLAMRSRS